MKQKSQKLDYPSWDDVLEKLDQIIELIRVMKKEKQLYRKAYEKAKKFNRNGEKT